MLTRASRDYITFYVTSDVLESTHMNNKPNIFFGVDIKQ